MIKHKGYTVHPDKKDYFSGGIGQIFKVWLPTRFGYVYQFDLFISNPSKEKIIKALDTRLNTR